jgi:hypothetical protein
MNGSVMTFSARALDLVSMRLEQRLVAWLQYVVHGALSRRFGSIRHVNHGLLYVLLNSFGSMPSA